MYQLTKKKRVLVSAVIASVSSLNVSATEADEKMDVVVVESTKTETPLSEVNNSVMVKTGEELERAGIYDVQDLEKIFPGLIIQARGNRTYANTTVRGISSPDFYSPTVSVYLDGVLQDSTFISQPLVNVAKVELLRGPQGTLYGGNAQGGVINIITKKASKQAKLKTSALYSNLSKQVDASAASPLSDNVYADLSTRYVYDDGTIDHIPSGKSDANRANERSVRARFHYLPEDSPLTATLSIAADKLNSNEEWYLSESEYDAGQTSQNVPDLDRDVYSYALHLGYDFGRSQLSSISAYQDRKIGRNYLGGIGTEDQKMFSQEFRLNTQINPALKTVMGAYIESRDLDVEYNGALNQLDYRTYALFGQGNYQFAPRWDVTLGARVSYAKVESDYEGNPSFGIGAYDESDTETTVSPKVALGWQATENTRLYASVTSGYRPGGFNVIPRSFADSNGYDDEKSLNGEIGWRSNLFENMVSFSGAFYWIKTDDIQLYTGSVGNQRLANKGDALSKGIEAELAFYPTDNLTLTAAGAYGHSTFESDTDGLDGKRLPYAPDMTATMGVEYHLPQTNVSVSSQAHYTSRTYFDESNSLSQEAYTLVDMSLNYDYNDALSLSLFCNNLTDEEYVTYQFQGGGTFSNYGVGREVGVKVSYDW